MEIWGESLFNILVVLYLDNSVVVYVINKNFFKDLYLMKLMRCFMLVLLKYNIYFFVEYIFGFYNVVFDLFFCLQI